MNRSVLGKDSTRSSKGWRRVQMAYTWRNLSDRNGNVNTTKPVRQEATVVRRTITKFYPVDFRFPLTTYEASLVFLVESGQVGWYRYYTVPQLPNWVGTNKWNNFRGPYSQIKKKNPNLQNCLIENVINRKPSRNRKVFRLNNSFEIQTKI